MINCCVDTIRGILNGSLPQAAGEWQQGVAGWRYKRVRTGGDTPPGKKPVYLIWLTWSPGSPEEAYHRRVAAIIAGEEAPAPPATHQVFVAPHRGILGWWYQQVGGTIKGPPPRPGGDLPLVFAIRKTGEDLLKVQVGIALWRQETGSPQWKQEFESWLLKWIRKNHPDEEGAGEIAVRLLKEFRPLADSSPLGYLRRRTHQLEKTTSVMGELYTKLSAEDEAFGTTEEKEDIAAGTPFRHQKAEEKEREQQFFTVETCSQVQRAANEAKCSRRTVYRSLQRLGFYHETTCQQQDGNVTLVRSRRKYEITPQAVGEVKRLIKQRQNHTELVKYVAQKRGVGTRAAQRWVQRRLKQGKTLEEITQEILQQRNQPEGL